MEPFFVERNGCFNEDWILLTSPHVKNINLQLHLNGVCNKFEDKYSKSVNLLQKEMDKSSIKTMINEIVLDLISTIKQSDPALPNMENKNDFIYYFTRLNKEYNVEYSTYAMKLFNEFINKDIKNSLISNNFINNNSMADCDN